MNNTMEHECGCDVTSPPATGGELSAAKVKERVVRSAKEASAAVKETSSQVASKAKEMSEEAAQQLRDRSRDFAHNRKDEFAERIKGGGAAVRRAAEKLREEDDPNIADYASALAERIESAGNYLQNRDFNAMRRDLENAARRRPELVFGGMFLAGLAIARFLKASNADETHEMYYSGEDDYDYETDEEEPVNTPQVSMADVPAGANSPAMAPSRAM
jgi:hypothetical protein